MENHFIESGEATFLTLSLLVHFRESLHGINRESLLSEKLFDRAPAGFNRESALGALPNGAQDLNLLSNSYTSFIFLILDCVHPVLACVLNSLAGKPSR